MIKNVDDFFLIKGITVGMAKKWMLKQDQDAKENLVSLIQHRFYNRYIKHVKSTDSGFLIMAVCCLMIETFESFKQGKEDTIGISRDMFASFFNSERHYFPNFYKLGNQFYYDVRCGILHQAETTNAWRILRDGELLNQSDRTINASKFIEALEKCMNGYLKKLNEIEFDDPLWKNALFKIEDICKNCAPKKRSAYRSKS